MIIFHAFANARSFHPGFSWLFLVSLSRINRSKVIDHFLFSSLFLPFFSYLPRHSQFLFQLKQKR